MHQQHDKSVPTDLEARLIYQWLSLIFLPHIRSPTHFARWCETVNAATSEAAIEAANQRLILSSTYSGDFVFQFLEEGFLSTHRELIAAYRNTPDLSMRVQQVCPSLIALTWEVSRAQKFEPPFFFEWWSALQQDSPIEDVMRALEQQPVRLADATILTSFKEQVSQLKPSYCCHKAYKEAKSVNHPIALINRSTVRSLREVSALGGGMVSNIARVQSMNTVSADELITGLIALMKPDLADRSPDAPEVERRLHQMRGTWLVEAIKRADSPIMPHYKPQKIKMAFDSRIKKGQMTPQLADARARFVESLSLWSQQVADAVEQQWMTEASTITAKAQQNPAWAAIPYKILTNDSDPWRTPLNTTLARKVGPILQLNTDHILAALEHYYDPVPKPRDERELRQNLYFRPLEQGLYQALLEAEKNCRQRTGPKFFERAIASGQQDLASIENNLAALPNELPGTMRKRDEYNDLCGEMALSIKHFHLKCAYLNNIMMRVYKHPATANSVSQKFGYSDRSWLEEMGNLVDEGARRFKQWGKDLEDKYPQSRAPFASVVHLLKISANHLSTNQANLEEQREHLKAIDHERLLKQQLKQTQTSSDGAAPSLDRPPNEFDSL